MQNTYGMYLSIILFYGSSNEVIYPSRYFLPLRTLLNLLNFLNEIIHIPFLELSNIILRDIKKNFSWSADILEPGQTAQMDYSI